MDALHVAATGLKAGEEQINLISTNLSNINTPAYKKAYANFVEVVNRSEMSNGGGGMTGVGTKLTQTSNLFATGDLKPTGGALDVAINGAGFMEVMLPNGEYGYTRNGRLAIDEDGYLTNQQGYRLTSNILVPLDALNIQIDREGVVTALLANDNEIVELGQIELTNVISTDALAAHGDGVFKLKSTETPVYYGQPGEEGFGELQQGVMETSNVELVNELMDMMMAQRVYQANSQVIRQADQMMQITNTLAES